MKSVFRSLLPLALLLGVAVFAQQQPQSTYAQPKSGSPSATTNPTQPSTPKNLPQAPTTAAADNAQSVETAVGIGDLLKVSVMGAPDYDQEVRVGGSGDVNLAMVGPVH